MSQDITLPLAEWLGQIIPSIITQKNDEEITIQGLSGDAGARRYFTIDNYPEYLAVFAPVESENSKTFIDIAEYLRDQGVRAPKVIATDLAKGFLLIENLGEKLFLGELNSNTVEVLYGEAIITLLCMQQSPRSLSFIEDYSSDKLLQEADLFPKWFVTDLLGYTINASEKMMLKQMFTILIDSANEQPQCFVHRDFHSRNLIACDIGPPGVIDFQDAVWGPFTYDLVSLLRDCYVRWPEERVRHWLFTYANMGAEVGIMPKVSGEQLLKWFDLMGLQRHIKVLGVFSRLYLRDNKASYLQDLPLVIRYILEVARKYPELEKFVSWFEENIIPLAQQQSWYSDYKAAGFSPQPL